MASSLFISHLPFSPHSKLYSFSTPSSLLPRRLTLSPLCAMKKPKSKRRPMKPKEQYIQLVKEKQEGEGEGDVAIPQVITDRMMRRVGLSVGIPLTLGLLFFPFFYYLKVVLKIDVPNWIPFGVSFLFFGTSLLGVSYGIVSASWDPLREGSLLGWNEARRNWPVFWESLWGNQTD